MKKKVIATLLLVTTICVGCGIELPKIGGSEEPAPEQAIAEQASDFVPVDPAPSTVAPEDAQSPPDPEPAPQPNAGQSGQITPDGGAGTISLGASAPITEKIILYSAYLPEGQGIAMNEMNGSIPQYNTKDSEMDRSVLSYASGDIQVNYSYTNVPVGNEDQAGLAIKNTAKQYEGVLDEEVAFSQYDYQKTTLFVDVLAHSQTKQGAYIIMQDVGLPNLMQIVINDMNYSGDYEPIIAKWLLENVQLTDLTEEEAQKTPEADENTITSDAPAEDPAGVITQGGEDANATGQTAEKADAATQTKEETQKTQKEETKKEDTSAKKTDSSKGPAKGMHRLAIGNAFVDLPDEILPGYKTASVLEYFISYNNPETKVTVSYTDSYVPKGNDKAAQTWMKKFSGDMTNDQLSINGEKCYMTAVTKGTNRTWEILQDVGSDNYMAIHINAPKDMFTDIEAMQTFSISLQ